MIDSPEAWSRLRRALREQTASTTITILSGVSTMDEYKWQTGFLAALEWADEAIKDALNPPPPQTQEPDEA